MARSLFPERDVSYCVSGLEDGIGWASVVDACDEDERGVAPSRTL